MQLVAPSATEREIPAAAATEKESVKTGRRIAKRTSLVRGSLLAALAGTAVGVLLAGDALGTVERERSTGDPSVFGVSSGKNLPTPELPLEEIFSRLRTPENLCRFLSRYTQHRTPESVHEFFATYRLSPEDFLAHTKPYAPHTESSDATETEEAREDRPAGTCATYSEFTARWAQYWNGDPYIGRLMPMFDGNFDPMKCHEVTILRTGSNQFRIFSNSEAYLVDKATPEEALKVIYPDMQIFPRGGIVPYVRTSKKNWLARMTYSSGENATEFPLNHHMGSAHDRPLRIPDLAHMISLLEEREK